MRKRGSKYKLTSLHPWVARDYRPHSRFVIIKPKYVNEVAARLVLLGYKKGEHVTRFSNDKKAKQMGVYGRRAMHIAYPHALRKRVLFYALYLDEDMEWVLSRQAMEDLGI